MLVKLNEQRNEELYISEKLDRIINLKLREN